MKKLLTAILLLPVFCLAQNTFVKQQPTGTGAPVQQTSPTLVTPNLGTPTTLVLTNATGSPAGITVAQSQVTNLVTDLSNKQAASANLTTYAGIAPSANVQTLLSAADYAAFKTSLSLGNVENTALSTWAGTSNITTHGTITTGGLGTGAVIGGATITLGTDANYDIYYRNASGILTRLAAGTDGNQLTTHGTASAPTWDSPGGGGGGLTYAQSKALTFKFR